MIHKTAIIHPKAELDSTVRVGPYAVIDGGVKLGANCVVGPHVYLTGLTTIGSHNRFHAGCVIGDEPVDLKYKGEPTRLRIGDHNRFREHVTVNCANTPEGETIIGSHNFLTPHCHVGHNAVVGDHVILGGGAMVAGHAVIQNGVFISGNCLVHQFCRVGTLALMQGGSGHQPGFAAVHSGAPAERDLRAEHRWTAPRRFYGGTAAGIEAALSCFVSQRKKFAGGARRGAKNLHQRHCANDARFHRVHQTRRMHGCQPRLWRK